ncbi:MAG: hypothetical protein G01um10142_441 [Parcubacteria group bacterium Gr01-1014_2]|nr:MAG: hypothetical protein G01um10142_441 [Parcubacteria group bacterium Gr01-1014_2]
MKRMEDVLIFGSIVSFALGVAIPSFWLLIASIALVAPVTVRRIWQLIAMG